MQGRRGEKKMSCMSGEEERGERRGAVQERGDKIRVVREEREMRHSSLHLLYSKGHLPLF